MSGVIVPIRSLAARQATGYRRDWLPFRKPRHSELDLPAEWDDLGTAEWYQMLTLLRERNLLRHGI